MPQLRIQQQLKYCSHMLAIYVRTTFSSHEVSKFLESLGSTLRIEKTENGEGKVREINKWYGMV